MLALSVTLAFAFQLQLTPLERKSPPPNDGCATAASLACGVPTPGSLTQATFEALNIGGGGQARPDVFYLLTLPSGSWQVMLELSGVAGTHLPNASLDVASTSSAVPCAGPFVPLAKRVFNANGSSAGDANGNGALEDGEILGVRVACLPAGSYLVEVQCRARAPLHGNGDFTLLATCTPCATPPSGTITTCDAQGAPTHTFALGTPVFAAGTYPPDCFVAVRLMNNGALVEQQPMPARIPGSATWVNTGPTGALLGTNLEVLELAANEVNITDVVPAVLALTAPPGVYVVGTDGDTDGFFDPGFDTVDPARPVVFVPGASPDGCVTPVPIEGTGVFAFDTSTATTGAAGQTSTYCSFFGSTAVQDDLWFCWTALETGPFLLSTVGLTGVDTKVAIYEGCGCPTAPAVACNDDSCGVLQSTLPMNSIAGHCYTIQVGNYPGAPGGAGQFSIYPAAEACPYDDGTTENALGLNAGGQLCWMQQLGAVGEMTPIGSISAAWGSAAFPGVTPPNGTPTSLLLWEDPDDDGDPIDCVLVAQIPSTVQSVDTDFLSTVAVTPPRTMAGVYFIGAAVVHGVGQFPAPIDESPVCGSHTAAWFFGSTSGTANFLDLGANNVPPRDLTSLGFEGAWLLRGECPSLTFPHCAGDGIDPVVTTNCPCANFGALGNGCANSTNPSGGNLTATGTPAFDNVVLHGSGMPATVTAIYLKGSANDPGGSVFGDGVRCLDGTLIQLASRLNVNGASQFPSPSDTTTLSIRGATPPGSGLTGYYAVHYVNSAAAFCPPETFNVTNGWWITW